MTLLTNGRYSLPFVIDDCDFDAVSKHRWYAAMKGVGRYYIYTHVSRGKILYLHRLIINPPEEMEIDHINHITCDNRRENLRVCTRQENNNNRIKCLPDIQTKPNQKLPKIIGVNYDSRHDLWKVRHNGKHIAYFKKRADAMKCKRLMRQKDYA